MIKASFCIRQDSAEFTLKGHSGAQAAGRDIICAAVSSAAYMAANTITDILFCKQANADVSDGYMHFTVSGSSAATDIIKGLRLHITELSRQYPDYVKVTTEV